MSSAKHTIGPWVHHKDSPTDVITAPHAPHAPSIATIDIGPFDRGEIAANARLIAAAPDLLDALNRCLARIIEECADAEHLDDVFFARAAIAKTEGK